MPSKAVTTIEYTDDMESAVAQLSAARQLKKFAAESEKQALDAVKRLLGPALGEGKCKLQLGDNWLVTQSTGENKHIDGKKLLLRGVSPKVIADCTVTTEYTKIMVKRQGDADGDADGDTE